MCATTGLLRQAHSGEIHRSTSRTSFEWEHRAPVRESVHAKKKKIRCGYRKCVPLEEHGPKGLGRRERRYQPHQKRRIDAQVERASRLRRQAYEESRSYPRLQGKSNGIGVRHAALRKNHVVRPATYRLRSREVNPKIAKTPSARDNKNKMPPTRSGRTGRGGTYEIALIVKAKKKHKRAVNANADGARCQRRGFFSEWLVPLAVPVRMGDLYGFGSEATLV